MESEAAGSAMGGGPCGIQAAEPTAFQGSALRQTLSGVLGEKEIVLKTRAALGTHEHMAL